MNIRTIVYILASLLALPLAGFAQVQTASAQIGTSAMTEAVIELSPFTVSNSSERGYVATSSLAGSRMKTDLKDIASQIDVLTPEFLGDIGATNMGDAVLYSSNFGAPNAQNNGPNDSNMTAGPKLEARPRGLDMATVSSDFFATNLSSDFYNVERLNLAYGAQSILFGLGNAGGVLDASTKRAKFQNSASTEMTVDSWQSRRNTLDVNWNLVPKKLALRVVGLDSDGHEFTEAGRNRQKRQFATITLSPTQSTTVRASFEHVDHVLQSATNYLPTDFVSPWFYAGRPLFDNSRGNAAIVTGTDKLLSRNTSTLRTINYDPYGISSVTSWNGSALTLGRHQVPGVVDNRAFSLNDSSIFPVEIDPRVSARVSETRGSILRLFVEQKITQDLFVELGANYERRHERAGGTLDTAEGAQLRADPNRYLPGGTTAAPQTALNPNAGRLFIESFPHGAKTYDEVGEARLTVAYEFDAARKLGASRSWLGRHRLALLGSFRQDINESQEDRALVVGDTSFTTGDKLNASRQLRTRAYLDSPSDATNRGNYRAGAVPGQNVFGPWALQDGATGPSYNVAMFDNPDGHFYAPVGSKVRDVTQMVGWQSYLLKERIVGFVGVRRDAVKTYVFKSTDLDRGDYRTPGDKLGLYRSFADSSYNETPDAEKTTTLRTYGIVVHPLQSVSLFYNQSENTALPPGKLDPFGAQLPGTSSNGFDWGIRLSLLQDRVSLRLNVYEDNQVGLWVNPFQGLRDNAALIEQRLRGAERPAGIGPVPASTFDSVALPVAQYRSVSDKTSRGGDAVLVANITSNWDLRLTVGKQNNVVVGRSAAWIAWTAQRLPTWQQAGGLGWDNVTLASNDSRTIHQFYDQVVDPQIKTLQLASGIQRYRERPWRANFFTNYRFTDGWRKGLSFGGGMRWVARGFSGNAGMVVPGVAVPIADPGFPQYGSKSQTFVDVVSSYRRPIKLGNRKLVWGIQCNVRNLFDMDDLEVGATGFDGLPMTFVRVTPRQVILSTSLSF